MEKLCHQQSQLLLEPHIEKSGTYLLSQNSPKQITVQSGVKVILIKESWSDWVFAEGYQIYLQPSSCLEYYSFQLGGEQSLVSVFCGFQSKAKIVSLNFSSWWEKVIADISCTLEWEESIAEIYMTGIAQKWGDISMQGTLVSQKESNNALGSLVQQGIFLDSVGKIYARPILIPHTSQSNLKHSVAIEKIKADLEFYAQSRWLNVSRVKCLFLQAHIESLLKNLKQESYPLYCKTRKIFLQSSLFSSCFDTYDCIF